MIIMEETPFAEHLLMFDSQMKKSALSRRKGKSLSKQLKGENAAFPSLQNRAGSCSAGLPALKVVMCL